jgi:Inner membrane component of T3SS, cytoplasmic domain
MALLSRIYFNAVFGALGGLLGWMLFGVFGEKNASSEPALVFLSYHDLNMILGGALIGGIIGYFVVSVEAIRDLSLVKFARLATYGAGLGLIGGALGMLLGDKVNYWIVGATRQLSGDTGLSGGTLLLTMLGRGLGWSLLGMAIGMSEGFAARSLGKFSYGTLGGAIGGFVGGALFQLFYAEAIRAGGTDYFWSASVRVLRGWQEGREYPLEKPANLLGRAEHADIALFRDMKIEKQHAFIRRVNEQYVLVNNGAPAEQTRVNEQPIPVSIVLHDGDRIQLGNVVMRFQLRVAANRLRAKKPLPVAS